MTFYFSVYFQKLTKSSHLSEKNIIALDKEGNVLKEHSKRAWKCWMWIMIGLVMVIFICEFSKCIVKN